MMISQDIKEKRKAFRKFQDQDYYDLSRDGKYQLMPFRFHRIDSDKEVMVNEVGDFLIVPTGTVESVVTKQISKKKILNYTLIF